MRRRPRGMWCNSHAHGLTWNGSNGRSRGIPPLASATLKEIAECKLALAKQVHDSEPKFTEIGTET